MVDLECKQAALERIASEVVATLKLHPRWYGGTYRIWFADVCPGWKLKIGIYFDYDNRGTDMLTIGQARTAMIGAIAKGLQAAGIKYTLPPSSVLPHAPQRSDTMETPRSSDMVNPQQDAGEAAHQQQLHDQQQQDESAFAHAAAWSTLTDGRHA
jgi:hypothetical protein